jgi:hypothetical protein
MTVKGAIPVSKKAKIVDGSEKTPSVRDASDLLQKALKEPGVKELMEVYEAWLSLVGSQQAYGQVMKAKFVAFSSDSTSATSLGT